MKKLVFLLTLILSFVFVGVSLAAPVVPTATPQPQQEITKPAMSWHCLSSEVCSKADSKCSGVGVLGHRAKLTTKAGDLPAKDAATTVFVCIATEQGNVCTSGDSQLDLRTVGYDGVAKLKTSTATGGYEFQGLFLKDGKTPVNNAEIKANAGGKLSAPVEQTQTRKIISEVLAVAAPADKYQVVEPMEWQDYTPKGIARKWLALNLMDPVKLQVGTGGQQQGTFTFEGAMGRCAAIAWDPYGIVFDSQSLEPVKNATVTLVRKRITGQYSLVTGDDVPSILNPIVTSEDGSFSFFVPDGTYKLQVSAVDYVFPYSTAKLNSGAKKIYSDLYRGEDIVQKGKIQHRDIPVDSLSTPKTSPVKLISYFPLLDKGTNSYIIQGKVSHPLARVSLYGKKGNANGKDGFVRTRLLAAESADKTGQFEIIYDLNNLEINEMVGDLEVVKVTLATGTTNVKGVGTETDVATLTLDPILNNLEGYAYDVNGQVMPKATVGVYLKFSKNPAFETKADDKGFYRISSEYLPPMAYDIRYTSAGGVSNTVSTAKFIAQNASYFQSKKTNLYEFKNKNGEVFKATAREKFSDSQTPDSQALNAQKNPATDVKQYQDKNSNLAMFLIIVFLGLVGFMLVVYVIKKKQLQSPPVEG